MSGFGLLVLCCALTSIGVRIVTPFSLMGNDGREVEFIALFPDFGSPAGIFVIHLRNWPVKQTGCGR